MAEADKFTVEINDLIEENQFENYGNMMLRRYNEAEAKRIAKEIDKKIMNLGDAYITIKVKKIDLPDNFVKTMESGVNLIKELKEYKIEIESLKEEIKTVRWKMLLDRRDTRDLVYQQKETNKELAKANFRIDKLENDLEYYKNGYNVWKYEPEPYFPIITPEPYYPTYPIVTYSNENPILADTVTMSNLFKVLEK